MEANFPGLDVNLEILGFRSDDQSSEAEMARIWILATMDDDEEWFERRSRQTIKIAYASWKRSVNDLGEK